MLVQLKDQKNDDLSRYVEIKIPNDKYLKAKIETKEIKKQAIINDKIIEYCYKEDFEILEIIKKNPDKITDYISEIYQGSFNSLRKIQSLSNNSKNSAHFFSETSVQLIPPSFWQYQEDMCICIK